MIINWVATKAQQFLPVQDAGLDELNLSFDFALSPEIMNLLYAQNDACINAGDRAQTLGDSGAVAEEDQQAEGVNPTAIVQFALDEHELALA
ncbi:hypothetical protein B0F87_11111 [Methylobacter tundripaludum]|jgi:hypothetical protein|uniref:Uncharacterized protein n=1 Tax=Methylobacter tundripaludum TaxID=173365 RepID=A0A2S6H9H3_9GAMM|nr:hypothetical protein [Methylobacter tundripaludum]PPK74081.1 hypothetical protein B0F87_11111 [Methylobacter tundripaludum]